MESEAWYSPARRLKWQAEECYSERITLYEQESGLPLEKSAEVLSVRDIPSRRLLFRLVPSVRPTGATGCGLLPTPVSIDAGSGRTNRSLSPNATPRPTLARAAKIGLLPVNGLLLTPQASDGLRSGMRMETLVKAKENGDLAQQIAHMIGGGDSRLTPPVCRGDDGLSERLDAITFPKWRMESIKAYGNAWVPQVAYEIFRAINIILKKII